MEGTLENYRKVYGMLADQESRDIYLNRLNWLISGDLKYFSNIIEEYLPQLPDWPKRFREVVQNMKASLPPDRNIVFYGAGQFAPSVLSSWGDDERVIGFCSQTKSKQKNGYLGYPVMSPEELLARRDLSVVLSVEWEAPKREIKQVLREGNYPADQIYEISGVAASMEAGRYFNQDFIELGDNEVFIDVGCFDLSTSLEFEGCCKKCKKIYAFEPDPENYKVCLGKRNQLGLNHIELLEAGTWSKRTTLRFNATNGEGSCVSEKGASSIAVVPIDEAVDSADRVTMIKMDVEGAELESLKGAKNLIQRDKPKLAICIYHKPIDMTEIPLYIKELVPKYKLYVRHNSNSIYDTVLYAVMP